MKGEASEGFQMVKKQLRLRAFPTYVVSEIKWRVLSTVRGNIGEGVHG